MSAEYLLMSSFEPVRTGDKFEAELPLHLTIVQWFQIERERAFLNGLQNLATELSPVEVVGTGEALYGPNNDVPVRLVRGMGRVAHIHNRALGLIERYNGELRDSQWAGPNYSPHVSTIPGAELREGETAELRSLDLVRREAGERLKTIQLSVPLGKR